MKKSYLMIAAAALVFAACSNEKPFNEAPEQGSVIGFTSYANKLTRGTTKPEGSAYVLESYHESMKVYGTKTSEADGKQTIFNGVACNYTEDERTTGEWEYSPARYWDKQATNYKFVGFAPKDAPLKYTIASSSEVDASGNKFETTSALTLSGTNLQNSEPSTAQKNVGFTGLKSKDCDVMITKKATKVDAFTSSMAPVDLIYSHTLAKLVVGFKTNVDATVATVKITSVEVTNYKKSGTYATTGTWDETNGTSGTWTASGDETIKYQFAGNATALSTSNYIYFIESLVMPQNFEAAQELIVKYTIDYGSDVTEKFTHKIPMKYVNATTTSVFGPTVTRYNEDTVYLVKILVGPEVIKFDAGVYNWSSTVNSVDDLSI